MTAFRDPASVHSQIHRKKSLQLDQSQNVDNAAPLSSRLAKRASIAAFSSMVKDTVSWAGDRLNTYRDGLLKEEREEKIRSENRKQLLYMKMRNVHAYFIFFSFFFLSFFFFLFYLRLCSITDTRT